MARQVTTPNVPPADAAGIGEGAFVSTLSEADIAAAWDASDRNRPMSHQDDWRSTSFREFARSFAREIEKRVRKES